jgi:hypothetical protein
MLQLPYLLGHGRAADKLAVECRAGGVAIAVLACATWVPAHGEEATVPLAGAGACPRSAFHVILDVGHGVASPGADSARGGHGIQLQSQARRRDQAGARRCRLR